MIALAASNRLPENVRVLAIVVAELEFRDIQRHIFFADFVERADYAAFENRPKTLDRISMNCADDILATGVVDDAMRKFLIQLAIPNPLIGAEQTNLLRHSATYESCERASVNAADHAGNYLALALYSADNRRLARSDSTSPAAHAALIDMPVFGEPTDEGFVDLDNAHQLTEILACETRSHAMAHVPSGLIGAEAHHPVDLQRANPLLAGEHQMDYAEPVAERLISVLEDRPGDHAEAVALSGALVALPVEFHGERIDVLIATAGAADAFPPAVQDQVRLTGPLVREGFFPLSEGHLMDAPEVILGHGWSPSRSGHKPRLASLLCQVRDNRPN
jgi:hypothetical protein